MNLKQARQGIWSALEATLWNDLNGTGAHYIHDYEDPKDVERAKKAAKEVLHELKRKAGQLKRKP